MISLIMTLRLADVNGPACLEYSWVPEGQRRNLKIPAGHVDQHRKDFVDDSIGVTSVQVYVATLGDAASIENWQFPIIPTVTTITEASITVDHEKYLVIGRAELADGSTIEESTPLEKIARKCPTGLE